MGRASFFVRARLQSCRKRRAITRYLSRRFTRPQSHPIYSAYVRRRALCFLSPVLQAGTPSELQTHVNIRHDLWVAHLFTLSEVEELPLCRRCLALSVANGSVPSSCAAMETSSVRARLQSCRKQRAIARYLSRRFTRAKYWVPGTDSWPSGASSPARSLRSRKQYARCRSSFSGVRRSRQRRIPPGFSELTVTELQDSSHVESVCGSHL